MLRAITARTIQGPVGRNLKVVLWGDSGMGNAAATASCSAPTQVTHVSGLVTWTITGHGCYVGEPINIVNSEDNYWYGKHTISAVPDANTIQFHIDAHATTDLYNTKPADGIAVPAIVMSHQYGGNQPALCALATAGIIPRDYANLGGNTQTALSMAWHIERDLVDYSDYDVWFCATVGANDCRANGGTGNLKKALDNAKARLLRLKQAGKTVIFMGWMPNDSRDTSKSVACYQADGVTLFSPSTDSVAKATARFNQEMSDWCADNGIYYLPQYQYLVDINSTSGYAITGTNANDLLDDGVHVGKRGAHRQAKNGMAAQLQKWLPNAVLPLPTSLMDRQHDTTGAAVNPASTYIFRNPLLLTQSGTAGLAADCATSGSFGMPAATGFSMVARTVGTDGDAFGNNQTATYSTTSTTHQQAGNITLTLPIADIKLGGKIRACAHVQFTSLQMFAGYRVDLTISTSNYGTILVEKAVSKGTAVDTNNFDDTDTISEYIFTPWAYIPADAVITSAIVTYQGFVKMVDVAGTAGFTIAVGRPGIESVSA